MREHWIYSVFTRIGFHVVAFVIAGLISKTISWSSLAELSLNPSHSISGDIIIVNYFGLLLTVPYRFNKFDTGLGLGLALLLPIIAPWQLIFGISGIIVAILTIIRQQSLYILGLIVPLLFTTIAIAMLYSVSKDNFYFFLIFFVLLINVALFISQKFARHLFYGQLKPAPVVEPQPNPSPQPTPAAPPPEPKSPIKQHKESIVNLLKKAQMLPNNLATHIMSICQQAQLIVQQMESDPRDFEPGNKFLTRYLQVADNIVDNILKLSIGRNKGNHYIDQAIEQSEALLKRLTIAFAQQHQRLLDNNTMDLVSDLNVLDKMLKMEGFE